MPIKTTFCLYSSLLRTTEHSTLFSSSLSLSHSFMAGSVSLLLGVIFWVALVWVGSVSSSSKFDELFQPGWALDHFVYEGDTLKMKLDNYSGILINCFILFLVSIVSH